MNWTTRQRRIALLIATGILLATMAMVAGCQVLREFDKQLADAAAAPDSTPVTTKPIGPVTPDPEPPPPIFEIAAGVLAFLGYGGLAAYIRSTKKNGNAAIDEIWKVIQTIQGKLPH